MSRYCDCDEYSARRHGYDAGYSERYQRNPYSELNHDNHCECDNRRDLEYAWDRGHRSGQYDREEEEFGYIEKQKQIEIEQEQYYEMEQQAQYDQYCRQQEDWYYQSQTQEEGR